MPDALAMSQKKSITFGVSVRPSACTHQRDFQWTDLRDFYMGLSWKFIGKIQILLEQGTNTEHITWRPKYIVLLPVILERQKSAVLKRNTQAARTAEEV